MNMRDDGEIDQVFCGIIDNLTREIQDEYLYPP